MLRNLWLQVDVQASSIDDLAVVAWPSSGRKVSFLGITFLIESPQSSQTNHTMMSKVCQVSSWLQPSIGVLALTMYAYSWTRRQRYICMLRNQRTGVTLTLSLGQPHCSSLCAEPQYRRFQRIEESNVFCVSDTDRPMLSTAILQPGTAVACLPQKCRQPLSQLPSLSQWTLLLARNSISGRQSTSALSVLEERVTLASTSTVAQPQITSVLESLQGRQVGRLKPELVDKHGRIMLKNLTKAELLMWLEQQGSQRLHA